MQDDVEAIVRGLSEAQMRMIERIGSGRCMERYCDCRTLYSLDRRKLTSGYEDKHTFEPIVTLTPLGLSVQSALRTAKGESSHD